MTQPVLVAALNSTDLLALAVVLVLLTVSSFLALAETGLTRVSRARAAAFAEEWGRKGRTIARLVSKPERFLNPLLLVVLICQTTAAFLSALVADRVAGATGVFIALAANVVVVFVLVQAIPKTWAVQNPDRAALLVARPVAALAAFPPLRLINRALMGLSRRLVKGAGPQAEPFVSEEELLALADVALEDKVIEHEERELIGSIIEFGDTIAREVMVPRPDMVTVGIGATVTSALDKAIAHGYSRLPVIGESLDDVLGIVYAKDLMRAEREGRGQAPIGDLVRPAQFVPETKQVARLMREMQAGKFHMAILVDEYGGIAGLVTLEDCLEELVGDIVDEYDAERPEVEVLDDGEYRLDGGIAIDEVNELLGTHVPDEDWDTVGGFVFGTLGHVPAEGEKVDWEGWSFIAEKVDGRRIASVWTVPISGWVPPPSDDDGDGDDNA
ncbi:MAG: hemolysin family protein [Acidimicrobiales bacterium]